MDPVPPVVRLPVPASPPPALRVPVVAALAPVGVSLALFAVTGSPLTLLFAALGPVTALAGIVDSAIGARRHRRRERRRLAGETERARREIASFHAAERARRREAHPAGPVVGAADPRASVRWRRAGLEPLVVGSGAVRSDLAVEGARDDPDIARLAREAALLPDAPVLAAADRGVGVAGPLPVARAVARGLALQALAGIGPERARLAAVGPAWGDALAALPHAREPTGPAGPVDSILRLVGADGDLARIAVAEDPLALVPVAETVLVAGPDADAAAPRIEPVDLESFAAWCRAVGEAAAELGAAAVGGALPDRVGLGELLAYRPAGTTGAVLGATAGGPVLVDLVADGPHAVVGGTTGSGKSELLVTWIAAMAAGASPGELAFLLVDFKGGAGFAPVADLPHVVGVVTDLDSAAALRAVGSLRAEVRRRETAIAAAGLREHGPASGLPRLVIVVDEYAALVETDPELHALFGDLAARGRSLGVHLVVGTQRPSASVRDAVLANADLRVSLRVRDRADGMALVGSAAPAELPAEPRGRAVASIGGRAPEHLQVAIASAEDIAAIRRRWDAAPRPRRPWRDPLPSRIAPHELAGLFDEPAPADAAVIGAIDRPDLQAVLPWSWHPDGLALVLGGPRSGRSGLVSAIASVAPSLLVPEEPAAAWDAIEALAGATGDHGGLAVLVDDLDLLASRLDPEHRQVLLDRIAGLARAAPRLGLGIVATAASLDGAIRSLEPLVRSRILLRMPSRQEHLLAGGDGASWDRRLPPGGAIVDGHRAQLIDAPPPPATSPRIRARPLGEGPLAVVAAAPAAVAERLAAAGRRVIGIEEALAALAVGAGPAGLAPDAAVVADPAAWQARWGALETIGASARVLVNGLDPARFRTATGARVLPPPLPDEEGWCWMLDNGSAVRARLP